MKKIFLLAVCLAWLLPVFGQEEGETSSTPVIDMFSGTRTVNMHTVKQMGKKTLGYRIQHRLGDMDGGVYTFLGLDGPASVFLGFDYGISDKLSVGIGRHSLGKLIDGYVKWTPLQQTTDGSVPVTVGVLGKANVTYLRDEAAQFNGFDRFEEFPNRMSYFTEVMVARKFGDRLGLQLAPGWTHLNLVERAADANDIFSVTAQGSFKITKKLGVSAEYTYVINNHLDPNGPLTVQNSAGVSLDIMTGGHVFQVVVINSFGMNETQAIPHTISRIQDGKIRFGFNIARSFWL